MRFLEHRLKRSAIVIAVAICMLLICFAIAPYIPDAQRGGFAANGLTDGVQDTKDKKADKVNEDNKINEDNNEKNDDPNVINSPQIKSVSGKQLSDPITQTYTNTWDGYSITLPAGLTVDSSLAPQVTKYYDDDVTVVASVEPVSSSTSDASYFDTTLRKFIGRTDFQESNRTSFSYVGESIKVVKTGIFETFDDVQRRHVFRAHIGEMPEDYKANYSYVYISETKRRYQIDNRQRYYRFLIKHNDSYSSEYLENLILNSFTYLTPTAEAVYSADYANPVVPDYWNEETKAFYDNLRNSDTVKWGLFVPNPESSGINIEIPRYEAYGNTSFDFAVQYVHTERMRINPSFVEKLSSQGKVLVMTLRWTWTSYSRGGGYCVALDILRGKFDQSLKSFALQVKAAGHPIIIRMDNEFNGDWMESCGMATMCDPEIYRELWVKTYNIFRSVGVNNAIFMANPESGADWPGQKWNHFHNYLPPKEYMQIMGLTAYNMGNTATHTKKSFVELYDVCSARTSALFANWPWIIGEFGCVGDEQGVNKTEWIEGMFNTLYSGRYPQLKGAIWFNTTDNNTDGTVYRDFRLFVPGSAANAFMTGVRNMKNSSNTPIWVPWVY